MWGDVCLEALGRLLMVALCPVLDQCKDARDERCRPSRKVKSESGARSMHDWWCGGRGGEWGGRWKGSGTCGDGEGCRERGDQARVKRGEGFFEKTNLGLGI